jgi:hypothetical protein
MDPHVSCSTPAHRVRPWGWIAWSVSWSVADAGDEAPGDLARPEPLHGLADLVEGDDLQGRVELAGGDVAQHGGHVRLVAGERADRGQFLGAQRAGVDRGLDAPQPDLDDPAVVAPKPPSPMIPTFRPARTPPTAMTA